MSGIIDIVVNMFTPQEVELGQTGLDEDFKKQIRMPEEMRAGVTIPDYLKKMDQAGVDEKNITQNEAVILSMTKTERENPKIIDGSRKKRIANGSGTDVATTVSYTHLTLPTKA